MLVIMLSFYFNTKHMKCNHELLHIGALNPDIKKKHTSHRMIKKYNVTLLIRYNNIFTIIGIGR